MNGSAKSRNEELELQVHDLTLRLEEAQETLDAIRRGGVDALVVRDGTRDRVYTLQGADAVYRILFEALSEGVLTFALDGTVLYANHRFADLVAAPLEKVPGTDAHHFIAPADRPRFAALLREGGHGAAREEIALCRADGAPVPVLAALSSVAMEGVERAWILVVTDLTELHQAQEALQEANEALEERVQVRTTELATANEELEVANEEMASANEELAVANQELAVANQELRRQMDEREQIEEGLHVLAEASRLLGLSLDLGDTLQSVARLAVPRLADWCVVDLVDEQRTPARVAVAHVDPEKEKIARAMKAQHPPGVERDRGYARALQTGQARLVAEVTPQLLESFAADAEQLAALRALHPTSYVMIPLVIQGVPAGVMSFSYTEPERRYRPDDLPLLEEIARRAAAAIENARLYETAQRERQAAQRAEERTAALQAVTASLSGALTADQVAEVILRDGVAATLGARGGSLMLLNEGGTRLEMVHATGYPPEAVERWHTVPLTLASPYADAIRATAPVWVDSPEAFAAAYPLVASQRAGAGDTAWGAVPLVIGERAVGAIGLTFARRVPDEADREMATALARLGAQALERARLYESERRARAAAEEANQAKDQFVAMVSHELRNPLSAIQSAAYLLLQSVPAEGRIRRTAEIINRNTILQARLVNDLLDLSRVMRGQLQLQRLPTSLDNVVRAAVEAQASGAEAAGVALHVEAAPGLWVMGDHDRLEQMVANLLSNAIKFTPPGGEIRVKSEAHDASRARIVVEDTGIGIDQALLGRLFEMFQQGEVAGQHRSGLGIGLALVKGIAEQHGGRVWAESEGAGKGSRFIVELPLSAAPIPRNAQAPSGPVRVLLLEDNPDTRAVLNEGLRLQGYVVDAAGTAEEALDLLAAGKRPDVILADIGLPGLNGYEFLVRARELPGMAEVPALAVTGYGQERDVQRAREAGYAGHLVKPVDIAALVKQIREWVGRT